MNNSNNDNKEELNSISLGNVDNIGNGGNNNQAVEPVPPVSIGSVPVAPVAPDNNNQATVGSENTTSGSIPSNNVNEGAQPNTSEAVNNTPPPVVLPEDPNNGEEEKKEEEPTGPVEPKEPLPGIESPVPTSIPQVDSPIAPPVAPVNPIPDINTNVAPVAPISYDVPDSINNFDTTPIFDEIGTVPPIPNVSVDTSVPPTPEVKPAKPKKKGINKTLFVVLIILAIAGVGVAVYFFLQKSNEPKFSVKLKEVTVEVGGVLSTDINDYAIFYGINQSQCSLDTTGVQSTNEVNKEYDYLVKCGEASYKGKLKVVDTKNPEVTLKEAKVAINGTITPEDFIASCTYEFKEPNKVLEYVKIKDNYHVPIIVRDGAGNQVEVTGTLIVDEVVSDLFLTCTKVSNDYEEMSNFGFSNSSFNKITDRVYTFKFATVDEYNNFKAVNEGQNVVTYKGIVGTPTYDDATLKLTIEKREAYDNLVTEFGSELPASLGEMRAFFTNKGYSCQIK